MKSLNKTAALLVAAALIAVPIATVPTAASAASSLPQPVQQALLSALEDEYHAEAFYDAVMDRFGEYRPFSNIIRAERTHQAELIALMDFYGVEVPANTELGSAAIAAAVPASFSGACAIGVQAEIDNAALYDRDLLPAVAAYPDIIDVFARLRDASQTKHLPAFQNCAR
jgi:hypothetical protein